MTEREKQIQAVENALTKEGFDKPREVLNALAPWLKDSSQPNEGIIPMLRGIHTKLDALLYQPDAKQPAPTGDRYSVSIMRAKGSKWHEIATHHDWVTAVECADRYYGDPEIQAVQVFDKDDTIIHLRRKP